MQKLQQHWKAVLADFFPRWRAASQWRCTARTCRSAHGHCDLRRRIIEIGFVSEDDDALDLLLIHEIVHALASPGHGNTWQRRIAVAADTARKLGRLRLAELLDTEIVNYRERGEPLAIAYQEVADALLCNPDLTFADIKSWLAQLYGLRLGEVGKVFRRLGDVYRRRRKEALGLRAARKNREAVPPRVQIS